MEKIGILIIFISMLSCSSVKTTPIARDHGECNTAYLNFDNKLNDTFRVKFINSVVFDTTAKLIHGYIVDSKTLLPVQNTDVKIFNKNQEITLLTNNQGEFEIYQNLWGDSWNMIFKHPDYICMYVVDVVQAGGQWFYVKLEHK